MEHNHRGLVHQFLQEGAGYRKSRTETAPTWGLGRSAVVTSAPLMPPSYSGRSLPSVGAYAPTTNVGAALWIPVAVDSLTGSVGAFSWVPAATTETSFAGPAVHTVLEGCFSSPTPPVYFMTSSAAGAPIGQGTQGAPFISSVPVMRGQAPQLNRTIAVDRNQTMAEVAPPPWNPNGSSLKGGSPTTWNGQIANTGIALSASSCSTHRTRPVEENARDACSDISSMTFSPEFSNESERLAELNRLGEKPLALDAAQRALRILRWRQKRRMQVEAFRRERERNPDRRRAVAKRRPRIGGRFLPKALELSVLERRTQAQKEAEERHA